ncbi:MULTISPECIES: acetyl-CoA carboxylase biotin carboxyl carrier protein subunit [unclassified Rhizobium]|uniref:acetyl-CoA carboxylase biotin carboxyl carrier protein n=1 Tax=unclassified Rhizobium TaxID=2613769 RepID=UPI000EA9FB42|nr:MULTISPECIES: acetyl-CoA carboxylase biotin carboxyl carrier protein subunit [unclassified Rhizobium]AYG70104.1 acetyl-CoA carboxylase biotin carboxyl carrier protein subunit [Rhizobium sp. CCGE531]AYG76479.1 acetyl-CoA carboxylase biotin carboxyl carrier protein subunit [Rhizobium sp. CCGE532]
MDLSKIKTLIDFVGRSNVTELSVTEKDVTVRIFRAPDQPASIASVQAPEDVVAANLVKYSRNTTANMQASTPASITSVTAPIFGVLHRASAPGQAPFVKVGDLVEEGQTLFIIEAMKVFNKIAAPRAGRIVRLTEVNGGEVETGDVLAEIA